MVGCFDGSIKGARSLADPVGPLRMWNGYRRTPSPLAPIDDGCSVRPEGDRPPGRDRQASAVRKLAPDFLNNVWQVDLDGLAHDLGVDQQVAVSDPVPHPPHELPVVPE